MLNINVKKLNDKAIIPTLGSSYAAGVDLYACLEEEVVIPAGETLLIKTGLAIELPEQTVGLIYARSGLASKQHLAPANKVGVIDCDYRGELMVALHNHGKIEQIISPEMRIAQLVVMPYYSVSFTEVDQLSESVRGTGGFGSSGK